MPSKQSDKKYIHDFPPSEFMQKKIFIGTLLAISVGTSHAQVLTHCKDHEVTYFSCKLYSSKNIVSLCGGQLHEIAADARASEMWLQYRFGKPDHPGLIYPAHTKKSISRFEGEYRQGLGVSLTSIHFNKSGTTYIIESSSSPEADGYFEGVRIVKNKRTTSMSCDQPISDLRFQTLAELLDPKPR
ncbi:hypothetical protein ACO0LF_26985 [Undibacterium sp. Di27W]|uniref:hypothetical protein n=1 Tax=Undibacterium sp. Di27W TaxID=3413036 RepID=UPI003BF41457